MHIDPRKFIVGAFTFLVILIALGLAVNASAYQIASAPKPDPPKEIKKVDCPVPGVIGKQVIAAGYDLNTGTYWLVLDRDSNKRGDYFVEYEIKRVTYPDEELPVIQIMPFPVRYFLDTDGDGFYDKFFHDPMGNGRCEDIHSFDPPTREPRERM